MLSEEEKKEMLEDARNLQRREDFRRVRDIKENKAELFDDFLKYLAGLQQVFGDFPVSWREVITRENKL